MASEKEGQSTFAKIKRKFRFGHRKDRKQSPSSEHGPLEAAAPGSIAQTTTKDLWLAAFEALEEDEKLILQNQRGSQLGHAQTALDMVDVAITETKAKYPERNSSRRAILASVLGFTDVVDKVVAFDPTQYSQYAWTAITGVLTLLQNSSEWHAALFEAAEYIASCLSYYAAITKILLQVGKDTDSREQLEEAFVRVYTAILRYAAQVIKRQPSNVAGRMLNTVKEATGYALEQLNQLKKDLDAEESTFERWAHITRDQHREQEQEARRAEAERILEAILEGQSTAEDKDLLRWLSSAENHHDHYTQATKVRAAETGQWILEHDKYKKWRDTDSGFLILWLHGSVGSGKTVLCSTVIQDLNPGITKRLSYWYFWPADKSSLDLLTMLRSIIKQLNPTPLSPALRAFYKRHTNMAPTIDELVETLNVLIAEAKEKVYIIVDALDKYPNYSDGVERAKLLDIINGILKASKASTGNLRILVTSRRINDIEAYIEEKMSDHLSINVNWYNDGDIRKFASDELDCGKMGKIPKDLRDRIWDKIIEGKDRNFLWTALTMKKLQRQSGRRSIEKVLENLPMDLDGTYQRDMEDVLSFGAEDSQSKLDKSIQETRKMDIRLLLMLLTVSPIDAGRLPVLSDAVNATDDYEEVLKILPSSFVTHSYNFLRFAHSSAQEHLLLEAKSESESSHPWYRFSITTAHFTIAMKALSIILQSKDAHRPFFQYAAVNVFDHADKIPVDFPDFLKLQHDIDRLFSRDYSSNFTRWLQAYEPGGPEYLYQHSGDYDGGHDNATDDDRYETKEHPGELAGDYSSGSDEDAQSSRASEEVEDTPKTLYRKRLYYACKLGLEHTVRSLLRELAESPELYEDMYFHEFQGNPLLAACAEGHVDVVDLLLGRKFRLNQPEYESIFKDTKGEFMKSLDAILGSTSRMPSVTAQGHEATKIRITEKVLINICANFMASRFGDSQTIVKELLRLRYSDVQVTDDVFEAAIGTSWDNSKVLGLLLNEVGNISSRARITTAAASNQADGVEYLKQLFDRFGSDVPVTEEVVIAAAGNLILGHTILKLLSERKRSDIPVTEEVLMAAAGNYRRGKEVVEWILDTRGGDVFITEEMVKTAAKAGNTGFIEALSNRKILPDAVRMWQPVGLLFAMLQSSKASRPQFDMKVLEELLSRDDVMDPIDKHRDLTPVHTALRWRNVISVKKLLKTGRMDLERRDEGGKTILDCALQVGMGSAITFVQNHYKEYEKAKSNQKA